DKALRGTDEQPAEAVRLEVHQVRPVHAPAATGQEGSRHQGRDTRHPVTLPLIVKWTTKALIVEVATGRVGPALEHTNTVNCAAFSPDGRLLATSSTDNTLRLWSVPDGKPQATPLDLHRAVHLVTFAPNGRSLVTQDFGLVRLWALPQEAVPMARAV